MEQGSYKYWAFISYSHRDQAWAEWLHKALETYRVPRRLVGRESAAGPVPRRLFPVFRDLEELPSSPNLSGAIDQALLQSRYLIVIASPYAAVSKWVDQEIARFRAMGRSDRILCLIVDGEPHADLQPGKGFLECFPSSLRTIDGIEPIAADVRPGKDGKPATKLKLIAGLLGVGLDELRRRERRRRMLRNLGAATVCVLSAILLAGLWQIQQREKREALAQQALRAHIETVYEDGRQELLAHNQARAAVYLNEAYRLGVDTPALRFMLARAMSLVDAEKQIFQTGTPVKSLRFSPDSHMIATVGVDNSVRILDVKKNQEKFSFKVPEIGPRFGPRFSRDSRLVYLTAVPGESPVGLLNIWDADNGHLLASLKNPPSIDHTFNPFGDNYRRVAHVAPDHAVEIYDLDAGRIVMRLAGVYSAAGFSRDGRRLLTGSESGEVTVWDGDAKRKLMTLQGLRDRITSIDDSQNGTLLAAAARDGSIRVWNVATAALRLVAGHPSPNPGMIFNIDGTRLLTWAGDGARVWNTDNGDLVYARQFAGAAGNSFDISSNGRWVMDSSSSRLAMQDTQSGAELFTLDAHRGLPRARDISEDDSLLATGGPDGRVVLWEIPRIPAIEFRHLVDPLQWTSSSWAPAVAAIYNHAGTLIATGAGDGFVKLWDAKHHQYLLGIKADSKAVNAIDFSPDDSLFLTGGELDGVKLWDAATGSLRRTINCEARRVLTAMFSPDGHTLAIGVRGGITSLWNADNGERLVSFDRDQARSGRFDPSGERFAIGIHGAAKLWSISQKKFLWSTQLKNADKASDDVAAVDFSPDGQRLLVAVRGETAYQLDTRDGRIIAQITEPSVSPINVIRFDKDGKNAVLGADSGVAMVWRLSDGKSRVMRGHAGEVRSAEFSPDNNFVLTSGVDGTARIWDASTGDLLDTIAEHASQMPQVPFEAADFSADGAWVLTGSVDGTIRLWAFNEESRNPQQIESILRCRVPWRLEQESLVPANPEDSACPAYH